MTYTLNLKIEFKKLLVTFPSPLPLLYTVTFFSLYTEESLTGNQE